MIYDGKPIPNILFHSGEMSLIKLSQDRQLTYNDQQFFDLQLKGILLYDQNETYNNMIDMLKETMIYSANIINMFGGLRQIMKFPIINIGDKVGHTDYIDFLRPNDLSFPIMRGVDTFKRPFISLRYIDRRYNETKVETFFQRYSDDYLTWTSGGSSDLSCNLSRVGLNFSHLFDMETKTATKIKSQIETNKTDTDTDKNDVIKQISDTFINKNNDHNNYSILMLFHEKEKLVLLKDRIHRLLKHLPVGYPVFDEHHTKESDIRTKKDTNEPIIELI